MRHSKLSVYTLCACLFATTALGSAVMATKRPAGNGDAT